MTNTEKLDPEIKVLWIDALKSGRYKKGEKFLHNMDTDSWCCLGVLCDVLNKRGIVHLSRNVSKYSASDVGDVAYVEYMDNHISFLPPKVTRLLGLDLESDFWNLAHINDGLSTYVAGEYEKNYHAMPPKPPTDFSIAIDYITDHL